MLSSSSKSLGIEKYFSSFGDPYKDPKNIMDYQSRTAEIQDDKGNIVDYVYRNEQ